MKYYSEIILLVIILFYGIIGVVDVRSLAFFEKTLPGPGFFPMVLGASIVVLSLLEVRKVLAHSNKEDRAVDKGDLQRLLRLLCLLVITIVVVAPFGGVIPAMAIFYMVSLIVWNGFGPGKALLHTVGLVGAIYLIFSVWLGVQMPLGIS